MEDAVKVQRALLEMEAIMLPRKFVKGVLDELLEEYGGWTHIEADNYHLLADQCFERMEADTQKLQNGGRLSSQSPDPKPSRRNHKRSSIGAEALLGGGYRASPKKSTGACSREMECPSPKKQKEVELFDPPQAEFSGPLRSCIPRGARKADALTSPYAGVSEASMLHEGESESSAYEAGASRDVTGEEGRHGLEAKASCMRKCAEGKGKEIADEGKQLVVYCRANPFLSTDIGVLGFDEGEYNEGEDMILAGSSRSSADEHAGKEVVVYSGSAVPPEAGSGFSAYDDGVQEQLMLDLDDWEDSGEPASPSMSQQDDPFGAATGMAFIKDDPLALILIAQDYWEDGESTDDDDI